MPSKFTTISGRSTTLGQGVPQEFPIILDPAPFEGAVVYADNGDLKYSNGVAWIDLGAGPQGTQGIQGDQGVQGLQGDYGPGFTIIGSVADVNATADPQALLNGAFPAANIGEGVIDNLLDELWIYDGVNWVNIGSFRGVQGFQGTQGIQGDQGVLGQEGIQGERGYRGAQGVQGYQGTQGIQGDDGDQGIQGDFGPQGIQGIQGVQGDLGNQGIQGPQSIQGPQGPQGAQGIQGDQGFIGPQGIQGIQGPQGLLGIQGIQGIQGDQGTQGIQGLQGIQGFQGLQGIQGPPGEEGLSGGLTYYYDYDFANNGNAVTPPAGNFYTGADDLDATASTTLTIDGSSKLLEGYTSTDPTLILNEMATRSEVVKGYIQFRQKVVDAADQKYSYLRIEGITNESPGLNDWFTLTVSLEYGEDDWTSDISANGDFFEVTFIIPGETGSQGVQGTQGLQGIQGDQGTQGTQGIQGDQGLQGIQGPQGLQGIQGDQGTQGIQGPQGEIGTTGIQGTQGIQGNQGDLGIQGDQGPFGGITFEWSYVQPESFTVSDPFASGFKFNSPFVGSITELVIDDVALNQQSAPLTDLFDHLASQVGTPKGNIVIYKDMGTGNGIYWIVMEYTAFTWENGGGTKTWGNFSGTIIDHNLGAAAGAWQNLVITPAGPVANISFIPAGPAGADGIQGVQGLQGIQGIQGLQGTGPQGTQGIQGIQGTGPQGFPGQDGGLVFRWTYNTAEVFGFPGLNYWGINSSNVTTASQLWIDDLTETGRRVDGLFDYLDLNQSNIKGQIFLRTEKDQNEDYEFVIYNYSDWTWYDPTNQGIKNYGYFDVSHVDRSTLGGTDQNPGTDWDYAATNYGNSTVISFVPTGEKGDQGTQGIQGIQGDLGDTGGAGPAGGMSFEFNYLNGNTANSDPTAGNLKFNNPDLSSATLLYVDDLDIYNQVWDGLVGTLDAVSSTPKGYVTLLSKDLPGYRTTFSYTAFQDNTGWWEISVQYQSGGTNWNTIIGTYGNDVYLSFIPSGDKGETGDTGAQGFIGFQGIQGIQGDQGTTGEGGTQGTQGIQGIQGDKGDEGARTYTITNNGNTDYVVDGNSGNPDIYLIRGFSYRFDVQASGHPFFIKTDPGTGTGDQYNTGVTNNGEDNGIIIFTVPSDSPTQLYYQCSAHGAMVGNLFTTDLGPPGPQGVQGIQGIQGDGIQGAPGGFGGVTFDYTWESATGAMPPFGSNGRVRYNNASPSATTEVQMWERDDFGVTIQNYLRTIDDSTSVIKGHMKITKKSEPEIFHLYTIASSSENNQIHTITVAYASGNGTFVDQEDVTVSFVRTGDSGDEGAQGIQGIQGVQGLTGSEGNQGFTGAGFQGIQGFKGDIGDEGPAGIGVQGTQGIQGLQGEKGDIGDEGNQGAAGFGAQGIQGIQGIQGDVGGEGAQGFAGPYLGVRWEYDASSESGGGIGDGTFRLNTAFSTQSNATEIHISNKIFDGLELVDGWLGTWTAGNLIIKGSDDNESWDTSEFYIYPVSGAVNNGTYYTITTAVAIDSAAGSFSDNDVCFFEYYPTGGGGAQGIQGIQGDSGDFGAPGVQGIQGIQGDSIQGIQGIQGDDGAGDQGVQGTQGIQGNQGETATGGTGAQGVQGTQGVQGDQGGLGIGAAGPQGIQGDQGISGELGEEGPDGLQGVQGTQGIQGDQGDTGLGESGLQGIQGPQGLIGDQGFIGDPGVGNQGFQGTQGYKGEEGDQGFTGNSGESVQGLIGPQGSDGTDGIGTQGPVGFGLQGNPGPFGPDGPQGPSGFGNQGFTGGEGPPGIQGFQGNQGFLGLQGDGGIPGSPGNQGYTGFQGFLGGPGDPGPPGGPGDQGFVGEEGDQGFIGNDGGPGPEGDQGFVGEDGPPGGPGLDPGPPGPPGPVAPVLGLISTVEATTAIATALHGVTVYSDAAPAGLYELDDVRWQSGLNGNAHVFELSNNVQFKVGTSTGANKSHEFYGANHTFYGPVDFTPATITGLPASGGTDPWLTDSGTKSMTQGTLQINDGAVFRIGSTVTGGGAWDFSHVTSGGDSGLLIKPSSTNGKISFESAAGVSQLTIDASNGTLTTLGDIAAASDRRLKKDIITVEGALDMVMRMRGVYYNRIDTEYIGRNVGVIAQEMQEVLPEIVRHDDQSDLYTVEYGKLTGVLIEAIKELKLEIEKLKKG